MSILPGYAVYVKMFCIFVIHAVTLPNASAPAASIMVGQIKIENSSSHGTQFLDAGIGGPLFLTPFIDAGNLPEAKNLSRVALPADVNDTRTESKNESRVFPSSENECSHAGYFTVNQTTKSHLYFWFTPSEMSYENVSVPLILWLR